MRKKVAGIAAVGAMAAGVLVGPSPAQAAPTGCSAARAGVTTVIAICTGRTNGAGSFQAYVECFSHKTGKSKSWTGPWRRAGGGQASTVYCNEQGYNVKSYAVIKSDFNYY